MYIKAYFIPFSRDSAFNLKGLNPRLHMLTQKAPDKQRVRYTTEWMREPVPCSVVGATTETESTLVLLSSQLSSLKLHKKEGSPDLVVERRRGERGKQGKGGREGGELPGRK